MLDRMVGRKSGEGREPRSLWIPLATGNCSADLWLPESASGLVVVVHGSGSGKSSPRNRQLADVLFAAGWAVLLFDLLTPEEARLDERSAQYRFDIAFLHRRLAAVLEWVQTYPLLSPLPLFLVGGSTGAAVALAAAADLPGLVRGVVSRGGRPDLVSERLGEVLAPVLLVVGSEDTFVRDLTERVSDLFSGPVSVVTISGASHLFEEPGTMRLAIDACLDFLTEQRERRVGNVTGWRFEDRDDAGRWLAGKLLAYRDRSDVLVVGLPRGGVPVAARVARALRAPLDIWVVRKVGAPGNVELAIGAVASGGVVVRNDGVIGLLGVSEAEFSARAADQQAEVSRRDRLWRGNAAGPDVRGRTVIVVDDGLATGATALSAAAALRQSGASTVMVAVPVAASDALQRLRDAGIPSVHVIAPDDFDAVGKWYLDFRPVEDDAVSMLLHPEGKPRPVLGMGVRKEVRDEPQGTGVLFGHAAGGHPRAPG